MDARRYAEVPARDGHRDGQGRRRRGGRESDDERVDDAAKEGEDGQAREQPPDQTVNEDDLDRRSQADGERHPDAVAEDRERKSVVKGKRVEIRVEGEGCVRTKKKKKIT